MSPNWLIRLRRLEEFVVGMEKFVCGASLAVMTIATALAVVIRNFNLSLPNTGELGLAAVVPLTLVGGSLCTFLGAHVAVDLVQSAPWRLLRLLAELVVVIATLWFSYIYFFSGVSIMREFFATGDKLLDLGTPLWLLAIFFPIGTALMGYHGLMRLLSLLVERRVAKPSVHTEGDDE